jgi:RNA polymerase sigma-70 factor (ECF subfamily)
MSAQLEEDAPRVGTPASQAAVEECYRAEHARLWRSLLLFGGAELASDAVSEAFTQALHRGTAIRDLRRWVWRAAFAIARGELAARGRYAPELDDHPAVEMPASAVDLVRALRELTPKQRAALVLHHYAGHSNRETAAIMGSTAAAVGVHLERARRMRELLGTTMGDRSPAARRGPGGCSRPVVRDRARIPAPPARATRPVAVRGRRGRPRARGRVERLRDPDVRRRRLGSGGGADPGPLHGLRDRQRRGRVVRLARGRRVPAGPPRGARRAAARAPATVA